MAKARRVESDSFVPGPDNPNNNETLEGFAKRVEERLNKSNYGPFATERLVCRMMTSAGPQQAAMIQKWVEWRYGKAKEHHEHSGQDGRPVEIQIISHIPAPGDPPEPGEEE